MQASSLTFARFAAAAAVLLACLAALNLAVVRLTRNSVPRQVLARAAASSSASTLALGNSLIAAGFDDAAFEKGAELPPARGAMNLGLGASNPAEHLLLLRAALRAGAHPDTLVYGFYDLQLTAPINLSTHELFGNHAMLYYAEPEYGKRFFHLSLHDGIEFEMMRHFPMTVDRGAIWAKVELFRRKLAEQGLERQETNRFGNVADFSLLEAPEAAQFARDCQSQSAWDFNSAVREIFQQALASGARVVVVALPIHPYHLVNFYHTPEWRQYISALRQKLAAHNVSFVDATEWLPSPADFADHLHLTASGAVQFSERLGTQLRRQ